VAAAAERVPVADLAHELVHAVVGLGVRPDAAAIPGAMAAAVRLPAPLAMTATVAATIAAAMAATIAPALPAAVALAGQRGLPGQPKLVIVDGEPGGDRDQGQGRAASEEQAEHSRAGRRS
jgi:hypothetical protein